MKGLYWARRDGARPPGNRHRTGSACTVGVAEPSHVLLAMGADDSRGRGSLRFSLGHTSTKRDVDALGLVIREVVDRGRRAAAR